MQNFFFIRMDGKYVKLCFNEILYAEGSKNYTKIITESRQYLVLITMKRLEQLLPVGLFARIHKSFIVSLEKIVQFNKENVWLKDKELPVGNLYRSGLEKSVIIFDDAVELEEEVKPYYVLKLTKDETQKIKRIAAR